MMFVFLSIFIHPCNFSLLVSRRGHRELLARLDAGLKSTPGLYLGGNYKTGVSIGDCIQFGIDAACKVQDYVQTIEV